MELLKNLFRQNVDILSASTDIGAVYFRDFGMLEFEKYLSLKNFSSAKKTWFFRLDFRSGAQASRYLFFFGSPSYAMRNKADVTLHISREEPPGSFRYEKLDALSAPNVPSFVEIGYKFDEEAFVVKAKSGNTRRERVEAVSKRFIQEVVEKNFGG